MTIAIIVFNFIAVFYIYKESNLFLIFRENFNDILKIEGDIIFFPQSYKFSKFPLALLWLGTKTINLFVILYETL
jgi:hypothetical protein